MQSLVTIIRAISCMNWVGSVVVHVGRGEKPRCVICSVEEKEVMVDEGWYENEPAIIICEEGEKIEDAVNAAYAKAIEIATYPLQQMASDAVKAYQNGETTEFPCL